MKTLRISVAAFLAASLFALSAFAADASGSWKWSTQGRGGVQEVTAKLMVKEGVVTGAIVTQMGEVAIDPGTVKGDEVAFTVTREFNGNKMVTKYVGKLAGDTITGSTERPGRDGAAVKAEWKASRAP